MISLANIETAPVLSGTVTTLWRRMNRQCDYPNCSRPAASAFTRLCATHKARKRRHGAPDQQRISKRDLAPYVRRVRARKEKNTQNPIWKALEGRWEAVLAHSRQIISDYHSGRAGLRYERRAAVEALKVAEAASPAAVVETFLAMVMMMQLDPRRFPTDEGFRAQVVRRVRVLSDMCFGEGWSQETQRVKRYYRDVPPRTVKVLWAWLLHAFGDAAVRVASLEKRDIERELAAAQAERNALDELT